LAHSLTFSGLSTSPQLRNDFLLLGQTPQEQLQQVFISEPNHENTEEAVAAPLLQDPLANTGAVPRRPVSEQLFSFKKPVLVHLPNGTFNGKPTRHFVTLPTKNVFSRA
jgi:hypothetical protein